MKSPAHTALLLCAFLVAPLSQAADETEDATSATKTAAKNKGKLVASEFCPAGTIGAPVGISVDDQGRVFVTETNRRTMGELDIRKHWEFLVGSLACTSIEDKRAFIHANYHKGEVGDANHDGVQDWRDLLVPTERIYQLIDSDGDGKFDKKTVFAENFNTEITGVAGGVLAFGGEVYTTIQPDLYKLTDTRQRGEADKVESLSHGHGIHIGFGGHDMHGPTIGPDGRIYWSQGDKGYNLTSKEGRHFVQQYEGAVFRVDPDGANLEVFAHGLRNPQELAFDDYGNLFSVDNDADIGDRERFVYITEKSDSGWRGTYQYRNRKIPGISDGGYNPWMAEELWKPKFETQAAYLTPPLANYSDGPCGFKFNPGTALSDEYKSHFFLTQFPKKALTTFKAEADGAGFKMVEEKLAFSGLMMTGIAFGPDGAIYSADWGENAWAPHQKGRVAKIDVPGTTHSALRVETQRLLNEGMAKRPLDEVAAYLAHADQRIRLRAQFELVARGSEGAAALLKTAQKNEAQLARIHAIWGLGQLARRSTPSPSSANNGPSSQKPSPLAGEGGGEGLSSVPPALMDLLQDPDPEIRAQSAKVLGDARIVQAAGPIASLLADPTPRVRLLAGIALSNVARPVDFDAAIHLIESNKAQDAFLRHAGVVILAAACAKDPTPLGNLASHPNRQVRLAAIVALRRLQSPLVERFLGDKDEWVLAEVARAIHDDTSIPQALPALAKLIERTALTNDPLLRRAINANLRVGDAASAGRLVTFAIGSAPANLRADALDALAWFANTPKLDRVEGRYRELPNRDEKLAHAALDSAITRLLNDASPAVRNATVQSIKQLHFDAARDRLAQLALDPTQLPTVRAPALGAIYALKSPQTRQAVGVALKSDDARLRAAALTVLAQLDPEKPATLTILTSTLEGHSIVEQQAALAALPNLKSKEAAALLTTWTDQLVEHKVPAPLQLDVLEAASASKDKALAGKVKSYQSAKRKGDPLASHIEALEGGDAFEGEIIFKSGQCTQCHIVDNGGGNVGPDLTHVASRLPRLKLLESIVHPQGEIAAGFATISVTNKEGDTLTGTIQSENSSELILKDPDGQLLRIKKTEIDSRTAPTTAMPVMSEVLKPREIRDVVQYLSTLK
jgi:putative membrane-bound dehydrogenase-like protein